jgi:hypothetical protein
MLFSRHQSLRSRRQGLWPRRRLWRSREERIQGWPGPVDNSKVSRRNRWWSSYSNTAGVVGVEVVK